MPAATEAQVTEPGGPVRGGSVGARRSDSILAKRASTSCVGPSGSACVTRTMILLRFYTNFEFKLSSFSRLSLILVSSSLIDRHSAGFSLRNVCVSPALIVIALYTFLSLCRVFCDASPDRIYAVSAARNARRCDILTFK